MPGYQHKNIQDNIPPAEASNAITVNLNKYNTAKVKTKNSDNNYEYFQEPKMVINLLMKSVKA